MLIDDPPERPVCSGCMTPLVWIWPARTKRWVAMIAESEMRLQVHHCDRRDPAARWKPDPAIAESAHKGNALARRVLAGEDPFTEKEQQT